VEAPIPFPCRYPQGESLAVIRKEKVRRSSPLLLAAEWLGQPSRAALASN